MKKNLIISIFFFLIVFLPAAKANAVEVGGIINSNTNWTAANSPYILTSNVQVASEAILTIEPGVEVIGYNRAIEIWGQLSGQGTEDLPIKLTNIHLDPKGSYGQHGLINIDYSIIEQGSILRPLTDSFGSLILRNSIIKNTTEITYLKYPNVDCYIEKNIFFRASGISTGVISGKKIYIRNNIFYEQKFDSSGRSGIWNWSADQDSEVIVSENSFLSTDRVALALQTGYAGAQMTAINNFFNTSNTTIIDSMILDKNDNLNRASVINYVPFLESPDENTPRNNTKPTINLLGNLSNTIQVNTNFIDPGVIATDDIEGTITSKVIEASDLNKAVIGTYFITYNVTDFFGNAAEQVTRIVNVVDTIKPSVSFTSTTKQRGTYFGKSFNITINGSDFGSGIKNYKLFVDNNTTPLKIIDHTRNTFTLDISKLANGKRIFKVVAEDNSGNKSSVSRYFYVDKTKPKTYAPRSSRGKKDLYVNLYYKITDQFSPKAKVILKIKNSSGNVVHTKDLGVRYANSELAYYYKASLPIGTYRFHIYATDLANNTQYNIASNILTVN